MPCLMRVIWLLRWLEDSVSFSYFSFNLTALNIAGIRRGTGPAFRLGLYSSNSFSNLFKTILNRLLNRPGQPLIAISGDGTPFVEIVFGEFILLELFAKGLTGNLFDQGIAWCGARSWLDTVEKFPTCIYRNRPSKTLPPLWMTPRSLL